MGLKWCGWRWAAIGTDDPFMSKIAKRWGETCKRDKTSARILSFPGTCIAVNFMLYCIAMSTIYRINYINSTSLQLCLLITSTIACFNLIIAHQISGVQSLLGKSLRRRYFFLAKKQETLSQTNRTERWMNTPSYTHLSINAMKWSIL